MVRIFSVIILGLGLLSAGPALAQTSGIQSPDGDAGTGVNSNSGVVAPKNLNVDSGIQASGTAEQQSPDRNADGSKKSASDKTQNRPNSTNNQLTASPKGANTGGNDATK